MALTPNGLIYWTQAKIRQRALPVYFSPRSTEFPNAKGNGLCKKNFYNFIPIAVKKSPLKVYILPNNYSNWVQRPRLLFTGEERKVQGAPLIHALSGLGYKTIYLVAGPQMLDTMIREKQLSRLYLSMTHQLIAGQDFRTLLNAPMLGSKGNLKLEALYYEQDSPPGSGQFFMQFGLPRSGDTGT